MKKFNLLGSYPNPKNKRYVSENLRTIKHRIIASYRGKEFYDGKRIFRELSQKNIDESIFIMGENEKKIWEIKTMKQQREVL